MNFEEDSPIRILHVKDELLRVDWVEQYHIIHTKIMMSYLSHHCWVALVDLFGMVNVVGL